MWYCVELCWDILFTGIRSKKNMAIYDFARQNYFNALMSVLIGGLKDVFPSNVILFTGMRSEKSMANYGFARAKIISICSLVCVNCDTSQFPHFSTLAFFF